MIPARLLCANPEGASVAQTVNVRIWQRLQQLVACKLFHSYIWVFGQQSSRKHPLTCTWLTPRWEGGTHSLGCHCPAFGHLYSSPLWRSARHLWRFSQRCVCVKARLVRSHLALSEGRFHILLCLVCRSGGNPCRHYHSRRSDSRWNAAASATYHTCLQIYKLVNSNAIKIVSYPLGSCVGNDQDSCSISSIIDSR